MWNRYISVAWNPFEERFHEPEELRQYLEWDFCSRAMREWFSLSDCDMTTAREFITYLISFCFHWGVPTKDSLLTQTDDIGKYLYLCLENRRCAICNRPAEVHHVDRIGMGMCKLMLQESIVPEDFTICQRMRQGNRFSRCFAYLSVFQNPNTKDFIAWSKYSENVICAMALACEKKFESEGKVNI